MRSTIAHVSLNSPDAVAAFKASERSVANSWIRVVRLGPLLEMSSQWAHCEKDGVRVQGESRNDVANSPLYVGPLPIARKTIKVVFRVTTAGMP